MGGKKRIPSFKVEEEETKKKKKKQRVNGREWKQILLGSRKVFSQDNWHGSARNHANLSNDEIHKLLWCEVVGQVEQS